MATSQNSSGTRRKNSSTGSSKGKGTTRSRTTKTNTNNGKSKKVDAGIGKEARVLLLFCVILSLFLCVIGVIKGAIGPAIKYFILGLFGVLGYVVPLLVGAGVAYHMFSRERQRASAKLIFSTAFVFMVGIIVCFATGMKFDVLLEGHHLIKDLYSYQGGGGLLFGLLACGLYKILGSVGTVIISIILGIVCLVLVTERSFLKAVFSGGKKLYLTAKETRHMYDDEDLDFEEEFSEDSKERELKKRQALAEKRRKQLEEDRLRREEKEAAKELARENREKAAEESKKRREEEAYRKQALEDERLRREDRLDDERILGQSTKGKDAAKTEDFRSLFLVAQEGNQKDDIHEITLEPVAFHEPFPTVAEVHSQEVENKYHGGKFRGEAIHELELPEDLHKESINKSNIVLHNEANTDAQKELHKVVQKDSAPITQGPNVEPFIVTPSTVASEVVSTGVDPFIVTPSTVASEGVSTGLDPFIVTPSSAVSEVVSTGVEPIIGTSGPAASQVVSAGADPFARKSLGKGSSKDDVQEVRISPDLSSMPEPVTERTHEKLASSSAQVEAPKQKIIARKKYEYPSTELLRKVQKKNQGDSDQLLKETALRLQQTLKTFGVAVTVTDISQGPSVTRYELQLGEGIKVNKIVNLADDIKLNLAAQDIRIEAPIPGKAAVGIEIPNKETSEVAIRELLDSNEFRSSTSKMTFAVGKDISGKTIVADIAKMPHMLVAGATGSGKSVCINTLIMSILFKASPDEVKLIMIDPKVVELSVYNGIPHLMIPVVTDPKKASAALQWAVNEMTKRYQYFADYGVRDLKGYNAKIKPLVNPEDPDAPKILPQIIVIVDELADLMMVASKEVEEAICRLAQLARAAGIHLIIATQRPSVDVITGLIKANMPSRVAFKVTSGVDSRTILDMVGAERLLGKGDMLFFPQGYPKPQRVQGAFVSDEEVERVVDFLKSNAGEDIYDQEVEKQISGIGQGGAGDANTKGAKGASYDDYFIEACRFVVEKEKASSGMLQRVFKIGFNRAGRIVDQMEEAGIVGPEEGTKPRKVLLNKDELEEFILTFDSEN